MLTGDNLSQLHHEALLFCSITPDIPFLPGLCSLQKHQHTPRDPRGTCLPQGPYQQLYLHAQHLCVGVAGYQGAQQDDAFNAYRQRQGGHPRPPMQPPTAMPLPHQPAHSSQSGSGHGSDYGSGDRASLSGSEVASPTKSMQVLPPHLPVCLLAGGPSLMLSGSQLS